jgi:hypothetical protein
MDLPLGKLEHLDARTLWKNEAGDFTPWLAEHLPLLGEALGLDLELEEMEGVVGDFSCDIVAREVIKNRPVIIENQLERTDHSHLGQLLTYAGGLDAAVVVWISPEIRDEHRKALDWLNRHTDEEIDFFGVLLDAIRIDGSKPAVQFRPVAFPNKWGKAQSRKAAGTIGGTIAALRAHRTRWIERLKTATALERAEIEARIADYDRRIAEAQEQVPAPTLSAPKATMLPRQPEAAAPVSAMPEELETS